MSLLTAKLCYSVRINTTLRQLYYYFYPLNTIVEFLIVRAMTSLSYRGRIFCLESQQIDGTEY